MPSTNNGCESLNAVIKKKYTMRNKLHLSSFLPKIEQMLYDWSTASSSNVFVRAVPWEVNHKNTRYFKNPFFLTRFVELFTLIILVKKIFEISFKENFFAKIRKNPFFTKKPWLFQYF